MSTQSQAIDYSFWKVIDASVQDQEKLIRQGDTIRMGNNLIHIVRSKESPKEKEVEVKQGEPLTKHKDCCPLPHESPREGKGLLSAISSGACRICFEDSNTEENPIVCPCACAGSISGMHPECLRKWLDFKTIAKKKSKPHVQAWDLSKFRCEICNSCIPGSHKFKTS